MLFAKLSVAVAKLTIVVLELPSMSMMSLSAIGNSPTIYCEVAYDTYEVCYVAFS